MTNTPATTKPKLPLWKRLIGWICHLFLILFAWSMIIEPQMSFRHDHAIGDAIASNWPDGCQGLRIAVVSDPHVGDIHMHRWRMERIRRQVADAKPDLVLMPGDFIAHVLGGKTLPMHEVGRRMQTWTESFRVIAVLGNHDYSDQPLHHVLSGLREHGFQVLDNESTLVSLRGGACQFRVAGVGDGFSGLDSAPAALSEVGQGEPTILLTHDPRVATRLENPGQVSLAIAGHTHGGVVCIPFTKKCISEKHPWTYGWVRGWYHSDEHPSVLVSSGLGNSIFPLRFGSPPGWDLLVWSGQSPDR